MKYIESFLVLLRLEVRSLAQDFEKFGSSEKKLYQPQSTIWKNSLAEYVVIFKKVNLGPFNPNRLKGVFTSIQFWRAFS